MNREQDEIVKELREKVQVIISFYEKVLSEKDKLNEENNNLTNQIKTKEGELEEIKHKYETLKVAKSIVADETGSHDARIKVNKIVREIDKCIALLNR